MAESDKSADYFLLCVGIVMTGILTGGIAGIATQDDRYFKGVAIAVGAVLLAAWLLLPVRVSRALAAGYAGIGLFCFALVLFFALHAPGLLAYMLSKQLVETMPPGVQMVTLLLWLLALAAVSVLLYSRDLRRRARAWLGRRTQVRVRLGPPGRLPFWGAVALYINFVLIAMGCFAAFGFLLHTSAPPLFLPGSHTEVSHGALADFFLWHLLDAIPGLKVNETLRWAAPFTYERAGAGWLLLLFKVMVIVPAVAGIGRYLKDEDPPKDRPSAVSDAGPRANAGSSSTL